MSHIAVLVGSLRAQSLNLKLAELAAKNAPEGVKVTLIEKIDTVPFYNQDLDTDTPPAEVEKLRSEIAQADGVLIVTPENNGTIPAVLKNAIDWASRPYGNGALKGKPFAIIGTSLGADGGLKTLQATAHSLTIAGGKQIDLEAVAIPASSYNGAAPHLNDNVVSQVTHVIKELSTQSHK